MFDLKIIITVIITLGIILAYLGSSTPISSFFDSVGDKISVFSGGGASRDIEFSLAADKFQDLDFSAKGSDIIISGYTTATLKTGNLVTNKTVGIHGFDGSGFTIGDRLSLEGKMSKVQLPEITVSVEETVKSESIYTSFSIADLELKEYKLSNVSGTLTARGTNTQFIGDITIISPRATFEVNTGNTTLQVSGVAAKIVLSNGFIID